MAVSAPIAGRLSDVFNSRLLATMGLAGTTLGMLWLVTLDVDTPYLNLALVMVLLGISNILFNAPNTTAVMGVVPPQRRGVAAGTRTLLLNSGQTMAIAFTMAIVATVMSYQTLVALFAGSTETAHALDAAAFMSGLHKVFLAGALLSVVAMVCSALRGADAERAVPELEARVEEAVAAVAH
jgi:MFS family permease